MLPDGHVRMPDGTIKRAVVGVRQPDGSIKLSDGRVKLPDGTIIRPDNGETKVIPTATPHSVVGSSTHQVKEIPIPKKNSQGFNPDDDEIEFGVLNLDNDD